jgi:hypothetical protein
MVNRVQKEARKLSGWSLVVVQVAIEYGRAESPEVEGDGGKKGTMSFTGSAEQSHRSEHCKTRKGSPTQRNIKSGPRATPFICSCSHQMTVPLENI